MSEGNIELILSHFLSGVCVESTEPLESGLINSSLKVNVKDGKNLKKSYLLQRVNQHVFQRPEHVQENTFRLLSHFHGKPGSHNVLLCRTLDGELYHNDESGNFWRLFGFVEGSKTIDIVSDVHQAYELGRIFGQFHVMLQDFPEPKLHTTIKGFHHTRSYYQDFQLAMENDPKGLLAAVEKEARELENKVFYLEEFEKLLKQGDITRSIAHGDAKVSNVLFNETGTKALVVVDLDTTMPGIRILDFGDLVRSGCCPVKEDEKDLSRVVFSGEFYQKIHEGFLSQMDGELSLAELQNLPLSALLVTFELALRFLTDYLLGDTYFKVQYEGHNLDRFRVKKKLLESMEDYFEGHLNI